MISVRISFVVIICCIVIWHLTLDYCIKQQRELTPSRYSPSTSLSTVTPIYSYKSKAVSPDEKEEEYIENSNFLNYNKEFKIDDTEEIRNISKLQCSPTNFGYSIKNGEMVFPKYDYPLCSEINPKPVPEMIFDYNSNLFSMDCKSGTPYYILEPIENKGRLYLYDEFVDIMEVNNYKKPVKLTRQEFAIGGCEKDQFNNAVHFPKFNKDLYVKTAEKMQSLNIKHKPLIVMMLTIDSYSRRHFFRKLPETVKFLNSLNSTFPAFAAFDFKLHNIFGQSSVENMVPIFSGNYY